MCFSTMIRVILSLIEMIPAVVKSNEKKTLFCSQCSHSAVVLFCGINSKYLSIYINHKHSFLFDSITAELLNRSWWKWYHMKALFMLCVYSHESCWYDLHHGLQGQKGVCHEPPGGLGDRLQGYMGYQQICWDSQMQNAEILLVRTWHPHRQQGPNHVGNLRLGPLGN